MLNFYLDKTVSLVLREFTLNDALSVIKVQFPSFLPLFSLSDLNMS